MTTRRVLLRKERYLSKYWQKAGDFLRENPNMGNINIWKIQIKYPEAQEEQKIQYKSKKWPLRQER